MASILKLRRGNRIQNNVFTGAEGELSYDSTAKKIRVHDGITLGGKMLASEIVSVKDFGAVGDGVTDDSAAIQNAVNTVITKEYLYLVFPAATYKVTQKILVPSNVIIDGQGSKILGSGYTSLDNNIFETGYISGSSIITNIGTAPEVSRVIHTRIMNFSISNAYKAFNLKNFNEGCSVENIYFLDCAYAIFMTRSFYSRYINLMSRGDAGGAANEVYHFDSFVNVVELQSVFAADRAIGWKFSGGINSLSIRNCSAENCTAGMVFTGEINPINIDSCYFEGITGAAIDMTDASAHRAVTIDNNWFFNCGIAFTGMQMISGTIGNGNYYSNCPVSVNINDDFTSYITVKIPTGAGLANNASTTPTLPTGFTIGKKCIIIYPLIIYDSSTGNILFRSNNSGSGIIELPYYGECGNPSTNIVPFCTLSKSAGTSFSVYIDTQITFGDYVFGIFKFTITDNDASHVVCGRFYGGNVSLDVSAGKTVTVTNNSGVIRVTCSTFNHPTGFYSVRGIVRVV